MKKFVLDEDRPLKSKKEILRVEIVEFVDNEKGMTYLYPSYNDYIDANFVKMAMDVLNSDFKDKFEQRKEG